MLDDTWLVGSFVLLTIVFFAALCALSAFLQPQFAVDVLAGQFPRVMWSVDTDENIVALTIDDAPSGPNTERILNLLAKHHCRATFFVIGARIREREPLLKRILEAGHELGNHMQNDEPSIKLNETQFEEQLLSVQEKIDRIYEEVGRVSPRWFRPGSGLFNTQMLNLLDKHGFQLVLGNIYPSDPQLPYKSLIETHVVHRARPGGIIILHDLRSTTDALEEILEQLVDKQGFTVGTLTELLKKDPAARARFSNRRDRKKSYVPSKLHVI